jgi:hypothetical protein
VTNEYFVLDLLPLLEPLPVLVVVVVVVVVQDRPDPALSLPC